MQPLRAAERGFTLLEVLVAFIISALAIGVMIDGVVGGMRSASAAARVAEAVSLARSRLAGAEASAAHGAPSPSLSGEDGAGFHWAVVTRATAGANLPRLDAEVDPGQSVQTERATLYAITVTISWRSDGHTRQVRLDGAMIGVPPQKAVQGL